MKRSRTTDRPLPRSVNVPVLRRRLPGIQMGESRKTGKRGKKRTILLDRRLRGVAAVSALVHESLHQMDHRLSERTVRQLEKALVYLVIDNPDLFRPI